MRCQDFTHEPYFLGAEAGGPLANAEELARLEAILTAFPTTEAQDARLLKGAGCPGCLGSCELLKPDLAQNRAHMHAALWRHA